MTHHVRSEGALMRAAQPHGADAVAPADLGTARALLEAVVSGDLETRAPSARATELLFGAEAAAAAATAAGVRSESTVAASVRAARRALAMPVSAAVDDVGVRDDVLDAWLRQAVLVTARADGVEVPEGMQATLASYNIGVHVAPRTVAGEFGALTARLRRAVETLQFPRTDAAVEATGARDGPAGPAAHKSPDIPVWPREVRAVTLPGEDDSYKQRAVKAAAALGSMLGMPMTMCRHVETANVSTVTDGQRDRIGITVRVPPQPRPETAGRAAGGKKVVRRRAVDNQGKWSWTAACGPMIQETVVPWWRQMRDEGSKYLFPRFERGSEEVYIGDVPMTEGPLRDFVRAIRPGAKWHGLRRGLEEAMDEVHMLPGADRQPIPLTTKNAVTQRSNLSHNGSRDTYIHEKARALFDATRRVHEVTAELTGGLVTDARQGIVPAADDGCFETECAHCALHLGKHDTGYLCDAEGCMWTLCSTCWPHKTRRRLWCPAHTRGRGARAGHEGGV